MNNSVLKIDNNRDIGDFHYDLQPTRDAGVGLTERTIDYIVDVKGEPDWMREFRKKAYRVFMSKPLPTHWAGNELLGNRFRPDPLLPRFRRSDQAELGRRSGGDQANV
jgi:hypothetical protein